mmetsp:Transcript_70906/g.147769  ORF Transcript_70906/g.147769 Transcript_70906/m.147769 type:complete len:85 (-) Transcript_70906:17-271(-)
MVQSFSNVRWDARFVSQTPTKMKAKQRFPSPSFALLAYPQAIKAGDRHTQLQEDYNCHSRQNRGLPALSEFAPQCQPPRGYTPW